jgi:hypothetical protein
LELPEDDKCIETCRSGYDIIIVKIKIYYALLVEIKTIYNMHGPYTKIA